MWPSARSAVAELTVVLDDPVQDDRELRAVAAGQRVRVRLGDAAVRRPARVPEPVRRGRAVRAGGLLQVLELADRADVARARPPRAARSRPSRSRGTRDARDPASRSGLHSRGPTYPMIPHIQAPFPDRTARRPSRKPGTQPAANSPSSAASRASRAPLDEGGDASTEVLRLLPRFRPLPAPGSAARCPTGGRARGPRPAELRVDPRRLVDDASRAPRGA